MDYDFYKFTSGEFEHLVQALMQKLLGASSIVFGMGPDGARELIFEGSASFPNWQLEFYELNDPDEMGNLITIIEVPNSKTTEFRLTMDVDANATMHLTIKDKQSDKCYRYQFNNFHLSHRGFKKIQPI